MNTLKSAALVIVLLGVLYGVYVVLSKPHVLSPGGQSDHAGEDLAPPLIDYSSAGNASQQTSGGESPAPAALNASAEGTTRGGGYQPNLDSPASLPPPGSIPSTTPPSDPTVAGAGGTTRRSSYEAPDQASAPPLEAGSATASSDPATDASRAAALTAWSLRRDLQAAEQLVADNKHREALALLSPYYGHPDLSRDDLSQLNPWLDALAAKVIYSREHLLAAPYEVRRNETLFDIAQKYQVPWLVLQSINSEAVNDPQVLVPGTQLKVLPGPFRADVSIANSEITLFLADLYAGRFPFALGNEPPQPGGYKVLDKLANRTYYGADGRTIPANDPANPYGGTWIDLGHEVCIHGSPAAVAGQTATLGCISLSPQDARDVYGILSVGSDVSIRR